MLRVGLTGGIAAGKSLAARELEKLGAVVVDADAIAREVVEPGRPALREIMAAFGPQVLLPTGALDRAALGRRVFGDAAAREQLNSIVHPRVRERAAGLVAEASPGSIIVEDIPLLVETGQAPRFHLVLVVDAPEELRVQRMVSQRGMTDHAARERIAAQASTPERNRQADVVVDNTGTPDAAREMIRELWRSRLLPFNRNLLAARPAARWTLHPVPSDSAWVGQAERIRARLLVADERIVRVEHIGPTSVSGSAAVDVLDFLVEIDHRADLPAVSVSLGAAGYPPAATTATAGSTDGASGERLHASADPGRHADLHLVVVPPPAKRPGIVSGRG
ncbi:dephospho-CoA kinase [Arthrobacter sp. Br18]|uniref:dephospho-CoA kinase n=1 Tax=Arthrobacter sp. Br18 TaxID=1312954 RepID=UPI000683ED62|nr:dephospho-CoA kinase [Arthrobacter sp. Br18]